MAKYVYESNKPTQRKYTAIKCFDCNRILMGKGELGRHKGHEVSYVDADGNIDE